MNKLIKEYMKLTKKELQYILGHIYKYPVYQEWKKAVLAQMISNIETPYILMGVGKPRYLVPNPITTPILVPEPTEKDNKRPHLYLISR